MHHLYKYDYYFKKKIFKFNRYISKSTLIQNQTAISKLTSADFELEELVPVFARVEDSAIEESSSVVYLDFVTSGGGVPRSLRQDLGNVTG